MSTDSLPRRFPDEIWRVEVDWADVLEGETIIGTPTALAVGGFVVDQVTVNGTVSAFRVSGGSPRDYGARISLLATASSGERLGFTLGAPIRAR